jgi:hypothetical protein
MRNSSARSKLLWVSAIRIGKCESPCIFALLFHWAGILSRRSWTTWRFELAVGAAIAAVKRLQTAMREKCMIGRLKGRSALLSWGEGDYPLIGL